MDASPMQRRVEDDKLFRFECESEWLAFIYATATATILERTPSETLILFSGRHTRIMFD